MSRTSLFRWGSLAGTIAACSAVAVLSLAPAPPRVSADRPTAVPLIRHVLTIVLENADYFRAVRAPFLRELTERGALLTNFHAVAHPSYPNYLALISGSTQAAHDNLPRYFEVANLSDLLERAHVSWKVYAENLPAPCFPGMASPDGLYVRRHEPFASFREVETRPDRCAHIVNAAEFSTDVAAHRLPRYSLYIPNLRDDGHDTGLAAADAWLKDFLSPLLADPSFLNDTLIIVTFDEGSRVLVNRVYTALVGGAVRPGATDDHPYTHYSLLALVEQVLGLSTLGQHDATAPSICCVWKSAA